MPDLAKQKLRSRFEAWLLDAGADQGHAAFGERKAATIGQMSGTIVELGPGTGVNMRYYAPGVKVVAIEPNPIMHDRLTAKADDHGVALEIHTLRGESIDIESGSVDGVVSTLVLCGVDDPAAVVAEVHRVLKPGGTFFFIEHVVAPAATKTRRVQQIVSRPHRWMFNGCEVMRDTATVLRASSFESVEIDEVDLGSRAIWVRHQIVGTAIKPMG